MESKKKKNPTSMIEQTWVGGMAKMCFKKKKSKNKLPVIKQSPDIMSSMMII